jgi:hypothetical protein
VSDVTFGAPPTIIDTIYNIAPPVLEQIAQWLEARGSAIPVSQLVGYRQGLALSGWVSTAGSTTSTTFTNLASAGPSITGLKDGPYVLMWGCTADTATPATDFAVMSVDLNNQGVAGTSTPGAFTNSSNGNSIAIAFEVVFKTGSTQNRVDAKYKSEFGAQADFDNRWVVAMPAAS